MRRYPKIFIRSKSELAKRFATMTLTSSHALDLINDVLSHFNDYWSDSKHSQPGKNKYIRSAKGTPLGRVLKLIDKRLLRPHDQFLPGFIFGGVSEKSHIDAALYLLGKKRERILLVLDIWRFFEQISQERVEIFFHHKAECSHKGAKLLAGLCCVEEGPKGSSSSKRVLARGFATSTRLAVWCNLDIFLRLYWLVIRRLKGYDPRLAIFVDDIGISASRAPRDKIEALKDEVEGLLVSYDKNQRLLPNPAKTHIYSYEDGLEHLGLRLGRNRLSFGSKTLAGKARVAYKLKTTISPLEKRKLRTQKKSYFAYQAQINQANEQIVHDQKGKGT